MNKIILSFTLGLILTCVVFTNNSYAEGGNQIWLKKTKKGIDISCPTGFQYDEEIRYSCTKQNDSVFQASLSYNDLYVEEEFFTEKEIMKQAIISVKLFSDVKIIEKKTSTWFGKITADIKYESDELKGLQRLIVFNDGTVIVMNYLSKNKGHDTADKILSSNIRILEQNQVKELEKIQEDYTKQSQELANKREAEKYKQKLEQEKKAKEVKEKKKIMEAQIKANDAKIKANDDKLKIKARENIQYWKGIIQELDSYSGYASSSADNYNDRYYGFSESIKNYDLAIFNLKNTTHDKVDKVMNENMLIVQTKFNAVKKVLQSFEATGLGTSNKSLFLKPSSDPKELQVEFQCKQHIFSGTLKDYNNNPVSNASLVLMEYHKKVSGSTTTDSNGKWQIDVSDMIFYYFKVNKSGYNSNQFQVEC